MSTTVKRLTTRGEETARAVEDHQAFTTSGALQGASVSRGPAPGALYGGDLDRYHRDRDGITYVVLSYNTPIIWRHWVYGWYVSREKFSSTTARHRNLCSRFLETE